MKTIQKQLSEYIRYDRRMSFTRAAKELGISTRHISGIINQVNYSIGKKTALKIQEWSNGKFKASDLMGL